MYYRRTEKDELKLLQKMKQNLNAETADHDSETASTSKVVGQLKQALIPQAFHTTSKQAADAAIAQSFYACGIPFVVADSP